VRISLNPWRSLRGLPRDVWVIFGTLLVNRAGSMILALLAVYATRERGWSATEAGLLIGCYGVGSITAAPLSGWITDRMGPLTAFSSSLFCSGLLAMTIPLGRTLHAVAALVFAWSLAAELFRPASFVAVARVVAPEQRRRAFVAVRLALNLGISIGPALGALLASVSFRFVFLVDGVTSLIAGAVLMILSSPALSARAPAGTSGENTASSLPVWRNALYLAFCAATLPVFFVFFQFLGAAGLHVVNAMRLPVAALGFIYTLNTVTIVLCEPAVTEATESWPSWAVLGTGALLIGAGNAALGLARGAPSLYATVLIWTVGEMLLLPTLSTFATAISPGERLGQYMGAYQLAFGIGFGFGPWAGTWVYSRAGQPSYFLACLTGGVVSSAAFFAIARGSDSYPRPTPSASATRLM
jgi:predicted MFS family arabinose efflux permease